MRRNFFSLLGQRHGRKLVLEDPRHFITERAMRDERVLSIVQWLDKGVEMASRGIEFANADGIYYRDTRMPFMVADATAVTLSTTALCTPAATTNFCFLPANYFNVGKTVKLTQFGKMTTAATPGNLTASFSISNADNTRLKSSVAAALILNKTDLAWKGEGYCTCRTTGTAGSVMISGYFLPHVGLVASTAQPILIPDSANATVAFDSTATQGFNLQIARSGSTVETIATQALYLEALN